MGVDKIDRMKDKVISNLSKDKLKKYLFYLTRKYFETFMANDVESFNDNMETLMGVYEEYQDEYVNLMSYIYYCFYLNSILIISEKASNDDFSLKNFSKYDLFEEEDFEDELHHDIKNIFNKDRIRRRYFEKRINESFE